MPAQRPARPLWQSRRVFAVALVLFGLCAQVALLRAVASSSEGGQSQPAAEPAPALLADAAAPIVPSEFEMLFVRLPLAAVLGTALALRPRRRSQGARKIVVIQTQIMLAVVGAVIMLVVGNSLSRAFGIVGAAGLIRYRSNIADPKDAVVMLSSLAAGLAAGVGLYRFGLGATVFMMALLWVVEFFEPPARKRFELKIRTSNVEEFRPKAEGVFKAMGFEFELLMEDEEEIRFSVSAPVDVRTKDVSDTLRLAGGADVIVKWEEKRPSP